MVLMGCIAPAETVPREMLQRHINTATVIATQEAHWFSAPLRPSVEEAGNERSHVVLALIGSHLERLGVASVGQLSERRDRQGKPYKFEFAGQVTIIWGAGSDGLFDTADDVVGAIAETRAEIMNVVGRCD